ncbi:MAG: metallophosphoesterase family protein [Bacillota bacterium]
MKIGVISDTHITRAGKTLPEAVHEAFEGVDLILHAGDIMIEEVIIELEAIAPTTVVAGNNDGFELFAKYGKRRIIEVNGFRIGLTHGYGRGRSFMNAYYEFIDDKLDCIVYGHSHAPHNEIIDNVLYFNPGSPTNRRFQPQCSVGVLHLTETEVKGEIIYFD